MPTPPKTRPYQLHELRDLEAALRYQLPSLRYTSIRATPELSDGRHEKSSEHVLLPKLRPCSANEY